MRVVISGGAGFVGSHLCDSFVGQGHDVLCIDNLLTGSESNIEHLKSNPRFEFRKIDITEPFEVTGSVDAILHFASPASPIDFTKIPIEILRVGSFGTFNMLELARAKNAKYVFASTSETYGDPLEHPQKESYWGNVNPIGIRGVYDESKRFSEAMTMGFHRHHGVDTRIVRIFNTYGPRMRPDDGRVIPAFISQALCGQPITVFGNGSQTRSFQYVDDLVAGVQALLKSDEHQPVNIGNPDEYTILQLAETIIALTGSRSEIISHPLPPDDPKIRRPDITRARTRLGWQPEIPLKTGLERTIHWFRLHL